MRRRLGEGAFTLAELVVSIGVLVLLVFLFTQLLNTSATVITLGHKQMDADAQTRQLFDRMAIDFTQMIKRSDLDYYVKSSSFATGTPTPAPNCSPACSSAYSVGVRTLLQPGNDRIAFYSTAPGYYPTYYPPNPTPTPGYESPVSVVAYRVNQNVSAGNRYLRLERMGRGLLWNAAPTPISMATPTPTGIPSPAQSLFLPVPLASAVPTPELPPPPATPTPSPTPACADAADPAANWGESDVIGPQVFRFEYYYLLKGQTDPINAAITYPAILTDTPWDTRICSCPPANATPTPTPTPPSLCCHVAPEGMQDVAAIVVAIAVIDPKSKALLDTVDPTGAKLARLNGADGQSQGPALIDWGNTTCAGCPSQTQWQTTPGLLLAKWRAALNANTVGLPLPAISGIRLYERYFYLRPPTLLTP